MDLLPNFQPHTGVASSNASIVSSATELSVGDSPTDYFGFGELALAGKERFRTLPTLNVVFEAMGFRCLDPAERKIQFDLTKRARTVGYYFRTKVGHADITSILQSRAAKRATSTWKDFSSSGFSRTDTPLSATL